MHEISVAENNRTKEKIMFLTQDEFSILLSELPDFYNPFVLFAVGTGLRFSEITALNSADFTDDRDKYSVSMQKAWNREGDGRYVMGSPKTERGRRTVGLSEELAKTIAPVVARAKAGEPIFTTVRGGKLTSSAFYNRVWKDAIDRAEKKGLRKSPRFHDMRHTFASWMLAEGMTISVLSYLMDQESEATTRNIYTHVMPSVIHASADIAGQTMASIFSSPTMKQIEPADDVIVDVEDSSLTRSWRKNQPVRLACDQWSRLYHASKLIHMTPDSSRRARRFADRFMGVGMPDHVPEDIESIPKQPVTDYLSLVDRVAPHLKDKD